MGRKITAFKLAEAAEKIQIGTHRLDSKGADQWHTIAISPGRKETC
jgi:hypothetical protein